MMGAAVKMKGLLITVFSVLALSTASGQTFIDQIDGGAALICSNDSGEWVCKPISIETIRELGYTEVEGLIFIDEPVEPFEPRIKK